MCVNTLIKLHMHITQMKTKNEKVNTETFYLFYYILNINFRLFIAKRSVPNWKKSKENNSDHFQSHWKLSTL